MHEAIKDLLEAAARLSELALPYAVAPDARQQIAPDDERGAAGLCARFAAVLGAVEQTRGWIVAETKRAALIPQRLRGAETKIRNLIRVRPLEVEPWSVGRRRLRVPSLAEIVRISAWLCLMRNATRDYVDLAALAHQLGDGETARVLLGMDEFYADQSGPGGRRVATQLVRQLAEPRPDDLLESGLVSCRSLAAGVRDWAGVAHGCRRIAVRVLDQLATADAVVSESLAGELSDTEIVDTLEHGDLNDWQPLAAAVACDPSGQLAETVMGLVDAYPIYGASPLWRTFIDRCRACSEAARDRVVPTGLAALRRKRGFTQVQVAERAQMTQSDLSKFERRRDVRLSTLRAYAKALGGRLRILFEAEGERTEIRIGGRGGSGLDDSGGVMR